MTFVVIGSVAFARSGDAEDLSGLGGTASSAKLELAIQTLADLQSADAQLGPLLEQVAQVADTAERERLQRLIDERMELLTAQARPGLQVVPGASSLDEAATLVNDLTGRIDALQLGPDASVEELRARDQVVAAIAGMSDPIARDGLIRRLEQREQAAQSPR